MNIMCQVCIDVLAQILVVLRSLYTLPFIYELSIVTSDVLGFSDVKFQLISV